MGLFSTPVRDRRHLRKMDVYIIVMLAKNAHIAKMCVHEIFYVTSVGWVLMRFACCRRHCTYVVSLELVISYDFMVLSKPLNFLYLICSLLCS